MKRLILLVVAAAMLAGCLPKLPDITQPKPAQPKVEVVEVEVKKVFKDFKENKENVDLQTKYMNKTLVFNAKVTKHKTYSIVYVDVEPYCKVSVMYKAGALQEIDPKKTYKITAKIDSFAEDEVRMNCTLPMTGIEIQ